MHARQDQRFQVAHHLAAVADAQAEGVFAGKELGKLIGQRAVEQDGLGPALARAQHVAVGEAAHGDDALEVIQLGTARDQVAHVHVDGREAGLVHHVSRLDVRVDALLAQDGNARTHAGGDERRGHVLDRSKVTFGVMPGSCSSSRRSYSASAQAGLSRRRAMRQLVSLHRRCSSERGLL
jgi:hypothetical protein